MASSGLSFELPAALPDGPLPCWNGAAFQTGTATQRVLAFGADHSGWTDALTELHETNAGADHFIDVASRAHAVDQLRRELRILHPTIMEIGCSGGHFLRDLLQAFPAAEIVGADYTLNTLQALGSTLPGVPLLQFDLTHCPLPAACCDAVVALNVLEHIRQDDVALAQISRLLCPNGVAVIEVPAGPALFDAYDEHLMHFRRYSMRDLVAKLRQAGLQVVDRSHLGFLLYPPFWLAKKASQWRKPANAAKREASVRTAIASTRGGGGLGPQLMRLEDRLRRSIYLPFGIRCLVTARKL